jgi:hypothetical protein
MQAIRLQQVVHRRQLLQLLRLLLIRRLRQQAAHRAL